MSDEDRLPNVHRGEVLLADFMRPPGLRQNALARVIRVPPRRIDELVHGRRAATADTDLRLCRYFGLSEGLFLRLQVEFDLEEARRRLGDRLGRGGSSRGRCERGTAERSFLPFRSRDGSDSRAAAPATACPGRRSAGFGLLPRPGIGRGDYPVEIRTALETAGFPRDSAALRTSRG